MVLRRIPRHLEITFKIEELNCPPNDLLFFIDHREMGLG